MKEYFIAKGNDKSGPFSLDELKNQIIFSDTLVWKEGWDNWIEAKEIEVIKDLVKKSPPPLPKKESKNTSVETEKIKTNSAQNNPIKESDLDVDSDFVPSRPKYDYSQIEDISGVDYKKAMIFTGILLVLNIITPYVPLNVLGMIAVTTLAVISWKYFKSYFDSKNDQVTGKWIFAIMGAHILFCLAYIYGWAINWAELIGKSIGEALIYLLFSEVHTENSQTLEFHAYTIIILVVIASIANFVAGFRILFVNRRYPFPLKRIAISTMLLLPILFLNYFAEGIARESEPGTFSRIILSLPYIFLLHHFYRAETEDATPN